MELIGTCRIGREIKKLLKKSIVDKREKVVVVGDLMHMLRR